MHLDGEACQAKRERGAGRLEFEQLYEPFLGERERDESKVPQMVLVLEDGN